MNTQPRHRFWQLHLSTAILLLFLAGGMLGLNVRNYLVDTTLVTKEPADPVTLQQGLSVALSRGQGWPGTFLYFSEDPHCKVRRWEYDYLALDFIVASVVLMAVAFLCEYIIRRTRVRLHFLTMVIVMFTVGGFVCANKAPHEGTLLYYPKSASYTIDSSREPERDSDSSNTMNRNEYGVEVITQCYGWPKPFLAVNGGLTQFLAQPFAFDLVISVLCIVLVALPCEVILRHRKAREP